ncbi:MAG: hypothetical protein FD123_4383 [Bacteroidetes bacterium]|nr:MAG: hypothetical protein FD123_4383 [Bacteroidota bacterium]
MKRTASTATATAAAEHIEAIPTYKNFRVKQSAEEFYTVR